MLAGSHSFSVWSLCELEILDWYDLFILYFFSSGSVLLVISFIIMVGFVTCCGSLCFVSSCLQLLLLEQQFPSPSLFVCLLLLSSLQPFFPCPLSTSAASVLLSLWQLRFSQVWLASATNSSCLDFTTKARGSILCLDLGCLLSFYHFAVKAKVPGGLVYWFSFSDMGTCRVQQG